MVFPLPCQIKHSHHIGKIQLRSHKAVAGVMEISPAQAAKVKGIVGFQGSEEDEQVYRKAAGFGSLWGKKYQWECRDFLGKKEELSTQSKALGTDRSSRMFVFTGSTASHLPPSSLPPWA